MNILGENIKAILIKRKKERLFKNITFSWNVLKSFKSKCRFFLFLKMLGEHTFILINRAVW